MCILQLYHACMLVVTHARVPHGLYWLSSDLGRRAAGTTEPIYSMCTGVSCVTTDLLHSLCIPFSVHITPFIGQLVSTTCGGCGMHPDAPLNLLTVLYYKRDRFRLLGGRWALGNFSHTMPVSR